MKDRLVLFFTYGLSIKDWEINGTLSREIRIYKQLLSHFEKIYFVTYGIRDAEYQYLFPSEIKILPKKMRVPTLLYSLIVPFIHWRPIRSATWLKTNQLPGCWSALIAKALFRKKLFLRTGYTESLSPLGRRPLRLIANKYLERLAFALADISSVTSQQQQEYVQDHYHPRHLKVLPNSIDTDIFKPSTPTTAKQTEKTKLLFVGRMNPEKNLLNMIRACAGIPNITVRLVGTGELEHQIREFAARYQINLCISSRVPNSELPQIYNDADIYIQPSLYEGNPKTILEAMSCQLPIIATDVRGINNIIKHKETGYLCKIEPDSIHEAIKYLLTHKAERCEYGTRARRYIEAYHALPQITREEIGFYQEYGSPPEK